MSFRHQHVLDLINSGRFRIAFLPLFWSSIFISLLPFWLYLAPPDERPTHGVLTAVSVIVFCGLIALSAYDVWVAGKTSELDSGRVLRRRSLFVFYASNNIVLIVFLLLMQLHVAVVLVGVTVALILGPWAAAAISKQTFVNGYITRA